MEKLINFLDNAHSVYHSVALLAKDMQQAGYTCLPENKAWELAPGGKYYSVRGGSCLIAFRIPRETPTGFFFASAHSDRPTFKIKENGEMEGKYTRLATEKYGGMLISTWLDRPLSVAGRVFVETATGMESRLVDIDRDLLLIPNVAIHMNRKANEGYGWNPAVDTLPLVGSGAVKGKFDRMLEETAGGKILGHDLYLYIRQKATRWGLDEEYLSAAALDDLLCAWCCTQGFLQAQESTQIPVLCIFDSEEVGSCSAQGACATVLPYVVSEICNALSMNERQLLGNSFMISADNAHALHPNHPEYADGNNAPLINEGVVLKFNANLRYATDGFSAAVMRSICKKADVPLQTYYNRADLPGGSTLGSISLSQVSVPTADIGLPQLAMHSCYETAGVRDAVYLEKAMACYFSSQLNRDEKDHIALV